MNDYYYGEQIDNFTFYRVSKALFTIPRYKTLSAEAKILYGLLLDRAALSTRNYTVKKITREKNISARRDVLLSLFVSASCLRTGFSTDSHGLH